MKIFWLYLIANVILIPLYIVYYYVALMGVAMGWSSEAAFFDKVLVFTIIFGILIVPNLIILIVASLVAFYRKKNVKQHVLWASAFMGVTIFIYAALFNYALF